MKEQIILLEELFEKIKNLSKSTIELVTLRFYRKLTGVIALIITDVIVIILISFMLFLLNIALALWIGELLGKMSYGFLIVGAFYGILGLLAHLFFRKAIHKLIKKNLVNHLLN
ncbi:MAG: hypothetical protein ACK4RM_08410 [Flavobacterium sp.]